MATWLLVGYLCLSEWSSLYMCIMGNINGTQGVISSNDNKDIKLG